MKESIINSIKLINNKKILISILAIAVPYLWFIFSLIPFPFIQNSDGFFLWVPRLTYAVNEILNGNLPLWNPYQFCGINLFADGTTNLLNPFVLLYIFLQPAWAYTVSTIFIYFILLLGTWLYFRQRNFGYTASFIGLIGYAYSGQVVFWSLYHGMNLVLALFPWILYFFRKYEIAFHKRWLIFAYILILIISLGGFIQFTFYVVLTVIIEGIEAFSWKELLKSIKCRGITVILGVLSASIVLLPTIENGYYSHRNMISYFTKLLSGHPIINVVNIMFGNACAFFEYPNYFYFISIILLLLAIFGLRKNFISIISSPFLVYSFIYPAILTLIYLQLIPTSFQFGVQSDPYRGMFIFYFTLSIIAALGVESIFKNIKADKKLFLPTEFLIGLIIMGFITFFIPQYSVCMYNLKILLLVITIILFIAFVYQFITIFFNKGKHKKAFIIICIVLLIILNSFFSARIYLSRNVVHKKLNIIQVLEKNKIPIALISREGRVVNIGFKENYFESIAIINKIRTIGGYGTFFPREIFLRIRDDKLITTPFTAVTHYKNNNNLDNKLLTKYGVQFLLFDKKYFKPSFDSLLKKDWELIYPEKISYNSILLFKNLNYMGRAYIADKDGNPIKRVKIMQDKDSYVKLYVNAIKGDVLILSDSWLPGWNCFDNGKKVKDFNANGFRGYVIKSTAPHILEWIYMPGSILLSGILSILGVVIFVFYIIYKRKEAH